MAPSSLAVSVEIRPIDRGSELEIVRAERDEQAREVVFGLFSTTYVVPAARRTGLARLLVDRGEAWMRSQGLRYACTDTAAGNGGLLGLFGGLGYEIILHAGEMVRLGRDLYTPTH